MIDRIFKSLSALLILATVTGCASIKYNDPEDPFEGFNRGIYGFNKGLDNAIVKPVTKGYVAITPTPVQKGVTNFFENLDDIVTSVNGLLQGKGKQGGSDGLRVLVNTTFGIIGLFDVATVWGLEKHDEDFGQTLGYWGVGSGAYVMLPFLGPSTFRGFAGDITDHYLDPYTYSDDAATRNTVTGFELLDKRSSLLEFDSQLEEAIDEYTFIKNAYLQNREFRVYDGNPPEDEDSWLDDECYDEEDEECDEE